MEELLIVGLVFATFFGVVLSVALITFGKLIDRYPVEGEETREISLSSPITFTRISVLVFWPLFIIGSFMVFLQSRFMLVSGIALLTGIILFLGTAVLFSAAVFNAMAKGIKESDASTPIPGLTGRINPFLSLRPGVGSRFPSRGKSSRQESPGYRK
jgi:hypothetical protein